MTGRGDLDAAVSRFLDEARRLVARFAPGAGARSPADEADAYEAAVRQAFLSPEGIEPAAPRKRSAPEPAVESASEPAPQPAVRPAPTRASEPEPEPDSEPTPEPSAEQPAEPENESARDSSAPPLTPGLLAAAPGAGTPPEATAEPEALDLARPGRRQAGETAPDHLLLPQANVDAAADDFFDGLVRQVEGDR